MWSDLEERLTAKCAERALHVDGMWPVALCESNGWRFARNGPYLGLWQHANWDERVHAVPDRWQVAPSWTNPRSQALVTALMVSRYGWSAWGGCA